MKFGQKENISTALSTNKNTRKVLVFGEMVFGESKPDLELEYCEIEFLRNPGEYYKLTRLKNYDIVIMDYSTFEAESRIKPNKQDIFEKQMYEALEKGTCFCFLHYDEETPTRLPYNSEQGYMDTGGIAYSMNSQIGFRWLFRNKIAARKTDRPIIRAKVVRNEFQSYAQSWGASMNHFEPFGDGKFDDIILSIRDEYTSGFSINFLRGKLIYLPCQRDFKRVDDLIQCLKSLIASLITYLARSASELPEWADLPVFAMESNLVKQMHSLESEVESIRSQLTPYRLAKSLAFRKEYDFENEVPKFFSDYLKIPIVRLEEFKEDFWILNSNEEKIVIGETKSYSGGFKRSGIYDLYKHRETQGREETFPGLLIINHHLNASSWNEKLRPIDNLECKSAVENNILILRAEDLLFFWNALTEKKKSSSELVEVMLKGRGWLEVTKEGEFILHNK